MYLCHFPKTSAHLIHTSHNVEEILQEFCKVKETVIVQLANADPNRRILLQVRSHIILISYFTYLLDKLTDTLDCDEMISFLQVIENDRRAILALSWLIIPSHHREILSLQGELVNGFLLLIDFVSFIVQLPYCCLVKYYIDFLEFRVDLN